MELDEGLRHYIKRAYQEPLLTREEEIELAGKFQNLGDRGAFNRLVNANLGLVFRIAKRYQGLGIPLEDLIQEGNVGLCGAMESYDGSAKLSSYASYQIKKRVERALNGRKTVNAPVYAQEALHLVAPYIEEAKLRGENVSWDEVVEKLQNEGRTITVDTLKQIVQFGQTPQTYLSECFVDGAEAVPSREETDPAEIVARFDPDIKVKLRKAITKACKESEDPQREETIFYSLHGLNGEERTRKSLADQFGITKERVRQIRNEIMEKLSNPQYGLRAIA